MIACIIMGLILLSLIGILLYRRHTIYENALSFRDAVNLTELPIVTFYNGHKKLNMLLDTGSSECIISKEYLEYIIYTETEKYKEVFGMEGNIVKNPVVSTTLSYSGLKFDIEAIAIDMSSAFSAIKNDSGVTIHGILGSTFFTRYKYILDFDKLLFYKK